MIDINGTDHGADVSLTTADIARFQFFSHQSRKQVDLFCIDAVVYRSVEAFKPIIDSFAFCCLPINETLQQRGEAWRTSEACRGAGKNDSERSNDGPSSDSGGVALSRFEHGAPVKRTESNDDA